MEYFENMGEKQDPKIENPQGISTKQPKRKTREVWNPRKRRIPSKTPIDEITYLNPDSERLHRENKELKKKLVSSDLIKQEDKQTIKELENQVKVLKEKIGTEENKTDWEQGPLIKVQNLNDIEKAYMKIGEGNKINTCMRKICNALFKFKGGEIQTGRIKEESKSHGKTLSGHLKILVKCGIIWKYKGIRGKFSFPDDPDEFMKTIE